MATAKRTRRNGSGGNKGNKRHGHYENTRIREYETTRHGGDGKRLYNGKNNDRRTTAFPTLVQALPSELGNARGSSNTLLDTLNKLLIHRVSCAYAVASCLSDCSGNRRYRMHTLS